LSYTWPNGDIALSDITASFAPGRTSLIGDNGTGKTTLLRLIAGELTPTSGVISLVGDVSYLPQNVSNVSSSPQSKGSNEATLADLLGISSILRALAAIEGGSVDVADFEAVGDDWDISTRAEEILRDIDLGLGLDDLGRPVHTLSGGEAMVAAIAGVRLRESAITLLDEPTNNLDARMRAKVARLVDSWPGTLLVVSHDLEILERMDATAELRAGSLSVFGGAYTQWREAMEIEAAAALQAKTTAEAELRARKRQRADALERTAKNLARGKQKAIGEGMGKGARDAMRDKAESGAGRARGTADDRIEQAKAALDEADARVRVDEHIRIDLPDPSVSASKRILELTWGNDEHFLMVGPERVALTGANGVGKTTLIEQMMAGLRTQRMGEMGDPRGTNGAEWTEEGRRGDRGTRVGRSGDGSVCPQVLEAGGVRNGAVELTAPHRVTGTLFTDRVAYLPQRLNNLDDDLDAVENVRRVAPDATPGDIRNRLARLLLRGDSVFRPVGTLSGGERFRVGLATLLLAEPPAQLLVLDEPTNNLDLTSVRYLVEALSAYRGAIFVVSHNPRFLSDLGIDHVLELTRTGLRVVQQRVID
jgi:ATPase subunit of ABC transporter with duplicated ATPase domains